MDGHRGHRKTLKVGPRVISTCVIISDKDQAAPNACEVTAFSREANLAKQRFQEMFISCEVVNEEEEGATCGSPHL